MANGSRRRRTSTKRGRWASEITNTDGTLKPVIARRMLKGWMSVMMQQLEGGSHGNVDEELLGIWANLTDNKADGDEKSWPYMWGRQLAMQYGALLAGVANSSARVPDDLLELYGPALQWGEVGKLLVAAGGALPWGAETVEVLQEGVQVMTGGLLNPGDVGGLEDVGGRMLGAVVDTGMDMFFNMGSE